MDIPNNLFFEHLDQAIPDILPWFLKNYVTEVCLFFYSRQPELDFHHKQLKESYYNDI